MISNITIEELRNIIHSISIIDIRSVEKYNSSHISGSRNIPSNDLVVSPSSYLVKGRKYYIYCQHGITSAKTCNTLARMGYSVVNIIGGYEAWVLKN